MDIIIERLNGEIIKLSDYSISVNDFKIDSPSPRFNWEQIEGQDGFVDLGTTLGERRLSGAFEFVAESFDEFPTLRNTIFKIFDSRESFYLIDDREPLKRWFVKANGFSPEQLIANRGRFDLDFISPSSYAESVDNTLNMVVAQISGNKNQKYKHTTASFEVLNDGDKEINPRRIPLVIQYKGTSTNLQIKNLTTGDTWSYTGTSAAGDVIELNGIRSTKNGLSIFRDTNRKLISIAPGWNEFQLVGTSGAFEISFDYRFYTL